MMLAKRRFGARAECPSFRRNNERGPKDTSSGHVGLAQDRTFASGACSDARPKQAIQGLGCSAREEEWSWPIIVDAFMRESDAFSWYMEQRPRAAVDDRRCRVARSIAGLGHPRATASSRATRLVADLPPAPVEPPVAWRRPAGPLIPISI